MSCKNREHVAVSEQNTCDMLHHLSCKFLQIAGYPHCTQTINVIYIHTRLCIYYMQYVKTNACVYVYIYMYIYIYMYLYMYVYKYESEFLCAYIWYTQLLYKIQYQIIYDNVSQIVILLSSLYTSTALRLSETLDHHSGAKRSPSAVFAFTWNTEIGWGLVPGGLLLETSGL